MKRSILAGVFSLVFLAGCASTQSPSELNRLQIKVAEMERKLEEKDTEIEDLKYDVKDLNAQIDDSESYSIEEPEVTYQPARTSSSRTSSKDTRIIRVSVNPKTVQKALKNAGYYDGTIDGKVGNMTKKSIVAFQKDHDLKSDGIIGQKTWTELKTYLD